ncbi:nucleotide sugar dehydrogenase [Gaopeijia maritima]|uniref:Nucleotide sugar dehydrogenase n=1 Tax=Gaopeijia maritima TaxID=3119007 RepID=A0ABU9E7G7_9BACT
MSTQSDSVAAVESRMKDGQPLLGIVGLGYVGLPLVVECAEAGLTVLGFDVNEEVAALINRGESHIQDVPADQVARLVEAGRISATTDMSRLRECDAISICVPTPLSKTRDPDVSYILSATTAVAEGLRAGQVVVLESTTYPGTTRELVLPELEKTGLKVGEDFFLCFSPERVDPGNATWQTRNTPKVIGGITEACTRVGTALYERFIDTMVPVSSAEAAELTKILENTFRAVNIGMVNETALIADRLGVDVWEVIEAAATKPFGFMKFTPGPGLGGHCIPVDPHYLAWRMKELNYRTRFIELASEVNGEMPYFVREKVRDALNSVTKPVRGSKILVLGVAYKRDIEDVRESPALDILRLLREDGADLSYHDPYVPSLVHEGLDLESVELTDAALDDSDAVLIVTDHTDTDYARVVERARIVVDTRNVTSSVLPSSRRSQPQGWIVKCEGAAS